MTVELLNFYIKKNSKDSPQKVYEACKKQMNNAELWIKALTYLREVDTDDGETYLMIALKTIQKNNIL